MSGFSAARMIAFIVQILASSACTAAPAPLPFEEMQVTATRSPEPVAHVPAAVTVVRGDELRARGANDLRTALALVAGVEISPGGDGGPAGAVPALWGLREFDAFLLVVDGVPWGGAFNPALTTLDLHNVERIEVMRGAAPVMFGATSFVGVIQIIHYPPGRSEQRAYASIGGVSGNFGTASLGASMALPTDAVDQSLSMHIENDEFADERAGFKRGHLLYRAGAEVAGGRARFDLDLSALAQDPASPVVREGPVLTTRTPLDANHNPRDGALDEYRFHLVGGFEREVAAGVWESTLAISHTDHDILRGFLRDVVDDPTNADGFEQAREIDDLYFDSHLTTPVGNSLELVYGVDWLRGRADQHSRRFEYQVGLAGESAPGSGTLPTVARTHVEDARDFLGLYAQGDWNLVPTVDLILGMRLNRTEEVRHARVVGSPVTVDERRQWRPSGTAGLSWEVWRRDGDRLVLYTDYRNAYKPAAMDFGPAAQGAILAPEFATSHEIGAKGRLLGGRLAWDLSGFHMEMRNLVVAQAVNGQPALRNAGVLKFRGGEAELRCRLADELTAVATYARHDLRFGDYRRTFNGNSDRQLRGNFQELAPQNLGSFGLIYFPPEGPSLSVVYNYTGHRFLNQRNTAKADGYDTLDISVGWNFRRFSVRLSGYNLGNRRDPVAESELGDAQYYRLPARSIELGFALTI